MEVVYTEELDGSYGFDIVLNIEIHKEAGGLFVPYFWEYDRHLNVAYEKQSDMELAADTLAACLDKLNQYLASKGWLR